MTLSAVCLLSRVRAPLCSSTCCLKKPIFPVCAHCLRAWHLIRMPHFSSWPRRTGMSWCKLPSSEVVQSARARWRSSTVSSAARLLKRLLRDPGEASLVFRELPVGVTGFFAIRRSPSFLQLPSVPGSPPARYRCPLESGSLAVQRVGRRSRWQCSAKN